MGDKTKIVNFVTISYHMGSKMEKTTGTGRQLPEEFLQEMEVTFGRDEAAGLAAALCDVPSVSLRVNRKKCSDPGLVAGRFEEFSPSPVPWCGSGFYLERRPDFVLDPLLHAGAYYVQEAASMVYESIVSDVIKDGAAPSGRPMRVLDLCAAPGGKSTAILNALEGDYVLVANEYDRRRGGILRENLNKWGDPNVAVTFSDAKAFAALDGYFDIIAADAPCSGEGMMRREPAACSQWSPRLVEQCASLQRQILGDVLPALRPGGFLIYSTCTFNRIENEGNCRYLTEELGLEPLGEPRRFMPHRDRCEGLFVALFRKPDENPGEANRRKRQNKNSFIKPLNENIFLNSDGLEFAVTGDRVLAMPPAVAETFRDLESAGIRPVSAGVEAGTVKGNLFTPSSRQLLSLLFDRERLPLAAVSREEALGFLRGQAIALPPGTPRGYVGIECEGYPLGLVKNIGNRANNLYPKEWRIKTLK